jgi:pilus assembly protein CpaF
MIPQSIYQRTLRQFFSPIAALLEDESVTEILVNGCNSVIVERHGKLSPTEHRFRDEEELMAAIRHLAQFVGRRISISSPILEARLPDGSRVEAIIPPAAKGGSHLAIRRFSKDLLDMPRLIELGALNQDAAHLLCTLVDNKQNIIVAGGTGSGKTSMLNALSGYIRPEKRVVVIEDALELQLQGPHVVQLEAQPGDAKRRGRVSIRDLFKATLRMRPDRIVIGEIRAGEALDLIQAMTSGHGGCLSTLHASFPRDALARLETMALMSDVDLPLPALRSQIASAIQVIVQVSRMPDGSRGITHITRVLGLSAEGRYKLRDLYQRSKDGQLVSTGAYQ